MFWGSFIESHKGPFQVWDKKWGRINSESYCEHTFPLILSAKRENPSMLTMQNGTPCHAARNTMKALQAAGLDQIVWPPYSPDLNPLDALWNTMKDYIQSRYPEIKVGRQIPQARLNINIEEAWASIRLEELRKLATSMPDRCQVVIDASSEPTRYC